MRAYLDHAASTPMRPEAVEAMLPFLTACPGNPTGMHASARAARLAVDDARDVVADLLGADPGEVVFTAGGTESDNLAVAGTLSALAARTAPGPIVCTAMEHHAVLEACRAMAARWGVELREVPPDGDGLIDLDHLVDACTDDVSLVSVMAVNNEIGTVQPLDSVARIVRAGATGAVLHTDAVQAPQWTELADLTGWCDLVSISAHKFGGPKGVGALIVRAGTTLAPIVHGGGQERQRRSGTHNVAGIVAMAEALRLAVASREETVVRTAALRDRLADGVVAGIGDVTESGDRRHRVAGTAHLRFAGVESEALVIVLDELGVDTSAGASCSSGAVEPSHVLVSMGLDRAAAASGIRFSLGWSTTDADVDHALDVVPRAVAQLRN